jgi:hypothetical protein
VRRRWKKSREIGQAFNDRFWGSLLPGSSNTEIGITRRTAAGARGRYNAGRAFSSYNIEQQGEIARGIYFGRYSNNIDY